MFQYVYVVFGNSLRRQNSLPPQARERSLEPDEAEEIAVVEEDLQLVLTAERGGEHQGVTIDDSGVGHIVARVNQTEGATQTGVVKGQGVVLDTHLWNQYGAFLWTALTLCRVIIFNLQGKWFGSCIQFDT